MLQNVPVADRNFCALVTAHSPRLLNSYNIHYYLGRRIHICPLQVHSLKGSPSIILDDLREIQVNFEITRLLRKREKNKKERMKKQKQKKNINSQEVGKYQSIVYY